MAVLTALGLLLAGCDSNNGGAEKAGDTGSTPAGDAAKTPPTTQPTAVTAAKQTLCPLSGEKVELASFTEHEGKKVYFCCDGCIEKFTADPAKYVAKLPQFGGKETAGEGEGS